MTGNMLSISHVFLILLIGASTSPTSRKLENSRRSLLDNLIDNLCPPLRASVHATVTCTYREDQIPCDIRSVPGTVAEFSCDSFYKLNSRATVECLSNGSWKAVPRCVPECGRVNGAITLIVNGAIATPGVFPWQAALYNLLDGRWEFWCGGSLISDRMVITAAHCTYKVPPENLMLAFGKFHRELEVEEDHAQKVPVLRVEMLQSYQDVIGNYNGDLAVLFLRDAVDLNAVVKPLCIDWTQELMDHQLVEGKLGVVLGWGLTENDTFSDVLRSVYLPVMSDDTCIAQQQRDFRKFVTYTSFCAGFKNGTGVCNGDSGGGLAFVDKSTDRWYLQGVVSVSPRRRGTSFCDPNFYTVFTKVSMFVKWLNKMKALENDMFLSHVALSTGKEEKKEKDVVVNMDPKFNVLLRKRIEKIGNGSEGTLRIKHKTVLIPYTDKILESATRSG